MTDSTLSPAMPSGMMQQRAGSTIAIILISLIGVFYALTIRDGHVWGDDQGAYIHHARNIAEGRPYGEIGFVRSPTGINPLMYPPGYPLLLAPFYHWYGLSLTPMKVMGIGFFCVALLMFHLLIRPHGEGVALATTAVIGLCPYFWDFKDNLYSEYPFLAFLYAALLTERLAAKARPASRLPAVLGILTGLLCGWAYWIRSVAIVALPAIWLANYARTRKIGSFSILAAAGFTIGFAAQKLLFNLHTDYLSPLMGILSIHSLLASPWYYLQCLAVPWDNGYSRVGQFALYGILGCLALYGFRRRVRREWTALELFTLFYILFIIPFPWGGRRYLMPVMPAFVFYALAGLRGMTDNWTVSARRWAQVMTAVIVLVTFSLKYTTLPWGQIPGGIRTTGFAELVGYIKSAGAEVKLPVFFKARLLAMYSDAQVAEVFQDVDPEAILDYYRRIGVSHFVCLSFPGTPDDASLRRLVADYPQHFALEKEFGRFKLFRVADPLPARASATVRPPGG